MRFVTLDRENYSEPAVMLDDELVGLGGAGFTDMISVIQGGEDAMDRIRRWLYSPPGGEIVKAGSIPLLAPIPRPPKIICMGLNYREHAAEGTHQPAAVPTVFAKYPTAATGHGRPIILPKNSAKPDYEAELAVIIGRRGRHVPQENWRDYVFGYTAFNDVSARDVQNATSQWVMGKSFDTFAPFGPAIVTADEIPDPQSLDIVLTLNGEVMQSSNTREMIFPIPEVIAYLSSVFTLEPGDVIATGTPAGVGFARRPPRWLRPGDEVRISITGIPDLVNPIVAEG